MNIVRKRLKWEENKHEALKILIGLSNPEIWIDYGIFSIRTELNVSHRTAKKLFKYWQKRWNFKINTKWDSSIRGLWALRPKIEVPLYTLSELKSEIKVDGDSHRFEFPIPINR